MKKMLVKVRDKEVVLKLKQFGEIEEVSSIFNIYSLKSSEAKFKEIRGMDGVISVEEDDIYEVQQRYGRWIYIL